MKSIKSFIKKKTANAENYSMMSTVDSSDGRKMAEMEKYSILSTVDFSTERKKKSQLNETFFEKDPNLFDSYDHNNTADNLEKHRIEHFSNLEKQNRHLHKNTFEPAITKYTDSSVKTNRFLRDHAEELKKNPNALNRRTIFPNLLGKPNSKEHEHISHMDAFLKKSPPAPHDFHVYTGLHDSVEKSMKTDDDKNEPHHKVFLPSYTSTSISPHIAKGFSHYVGHYDENKGVQETHRHILKIHVPKGSSHGSYLGDASVHPGEKEYLLKRGTKLHVSKTPEIHMDGAQKIHVWHAKIAGNHHEDN